MIIMVQLAVATYSIAKLYHKRPRPMVSMHIIILRDLALWSLV